MNELSFFSISGVACAAHTPETKKIWASWGNNKSARGRQAILNYAKKQGFICDNADVCIKDAFDYLLDQFPDVSGIKSFIMRQAIIHYSSSF